MAKGSEQSALRTFFNGEKYRKSMDSAIRLLGVAKTFAEDGAPTDAMDAAFRAIQLMKDAAKHREKFFGSLISKK